MPDAEAIGENTLEILSPDHTRHVVRIARSPFLIGRGAETGNHLALADPRISRECAAIISGANGCLLEDRGYRRGIFVNGKKVNRHILANGDVITFGLEDSYEIVFRSAGAEKAIQNMLTRIGGIAISEGAGLGKLNLLLEATSLLHSNLPLESVLGTMLDYAVAITHADRGLLLEVDSSGALRIRLGRGSGGVPLSAEGVAPSQTVLRQAMAQQSSVIAEDLDLAGVGLQAAQSIVAQSLKAIVAIPLYAVARAGSADSTIPSVAGQFLGIVYLDSQRRAAFSTLDRRILDALAVEAASILDNARLLGRERQRQRLEQELNIARDIQQALLPHGFHDFPYFAVAGMHTPCQAVGGDYFDIFTLGHNRTAILVADVSGKGLGAALLSTMLQGALFGMTADTDPVEVFKRINRFLCEHTEVGRYATIFFSILDQNGELVFVNAGHPSPLILRRGEVTPLVTEGSFPVGLIPKASYSAAKVNLQPSDTLILFSDGITEAMNPEEQLYGVSRLQEVLSGQNDVPLKDLQKIVLESIRTFAGGTTQADDITLLLVRYRAAARGATP